MELGAALMLAAQFAAPQGKIKSPLSGIRFIPAHGEFPPRVYATDLLAAVQLDVDVDVPNFVGDATGIMAALKADRSGVIYFDKGSAIQIAGYKFSEWCPVDQYPGTLPVPSADHFRMMRGSGGIPKVIHAVGSDTAKPELAYCGVSPGAVDATDGTRIATVPVGWDRAFQVHWSCFRADWPHAPADVAIGSHHVVWCWPGQIRWGDLYRGHSLRPFPDLSKFRSQPTPIQVVVPRLALRGSVRRAAQALRQVTLRAREGAGTMSVYRPDGVGGLVETVPALCHGEGQATVSSVSLLGALDACSTSRVLLGFDCDANRPLLVSSGSYQERIYPIVY